MEHKQGALEYCAPKVLSLQQPPSQGCPRWDLFSLVW